MDETDIDEVCAGRELDALVAERVLRLPIVHGGRWVQTGGGTLRIGLDWKPSADIADAWPVLEEMRKRGYQVARLSTDGSSGDLWQCSLSDVWRQASREGDMDFFADAETPELAICRCALKAATHLERMKGESQSAG